MKKVKIDVVHDYCVSRAAEAAEQAAEAENRGDNEAYNYWKAKEYAYTDVLDYVCTLYR